MRGGGGGNKGGGAGSHMYGGGGGGIGDGGCGRCRSGAEVEEVAMVDVEVGKEEQKL